MTVLLAEDDLVSRRLLESHLDKWGYQVLVARDGEQAWEILERESDLEMAILDWVMPGLDGIEICRRLRRQGDRAIYVVLCTARNRTEDLAEGLAAGADDFLGKPINTAELRARLRAGVRTVTLEIALRRRITELRAALAHVKTLQGLIPICMHCKRIRDDQDVWHRIECYIEKHTGVEFSHGLCQHCLEERYPEIAARKG